MDTYDRLIDAAAADLESAIRRSAWGQQTYIAAVPTRGPDAPGHFVIVKGDDPVPLGARIVRPCDNGASGHARWESVPVQSIRGILWEAARREPILPV